MLQIEQAVGHDADFLVDQGDHRARRIDPDCLDQHGEHFRIKGARVPASQYLQCLIRRYARAICPVHHHAVIAVR